MKVEVEFVRELTGHRGAVYSLFQDAEPNLIYSSSGDGFVVEWDLANVDDGIAVAKTGSPIYAACYLAGTGEIIAGTQGGDLYRFSLETKKQTGHRTAGGDYFDLIPFGQKTVLGACGNGFIYQDEAELETFKTLRSAHPTDKSARAITLSPNGKFVATGWSDGKVRVYSADFFSKAGDMPTFEPVAEFVANEPSVFCLLYIPGTNYLISGGRDAQLKVWDTTTYSLVKTIPAHWFTVNHMALSPDKTLFASASRDKTIKIWDAKTFDLLKVIDMRQYPAHTHSVNRLLWTTHQNLLISAGDDKRIKMWRVN
jgi:WD40 repeat protein